MGPSAHHGNTAKGPGPPARVSPSASPEVRQPRHTGRAPGPLAGCRDKRRHRAPLGKSARPAWECWAPSPTGQVCTASLGMLALVLGHHVWMAAKRQAVFRPHLNPWTRGPNTGRFQAQESRLLPASTPARGGSAWSSRCFHGCRAPVALRAHTCLGHKHAASSKAENTAKASGHGERGQNPAAAQLPAQSCTGRQVHPREAPTEVETDLATNEREREFGEGCVPLTARRFCLPGKSGTFQKAI